MTTLARLRALLARRILVLDGAMGTMVQQAGLDESAVRGERFRDHPHALRNDIDLLVLTRPELISSIHHAYLEAGADIIETNTFAATAIAQADFGVAPLVHELNVTATRLARQAASAWAERTPDQPRFVAGAIGPTNRALSMPPGNGDPAHRAETFARLRDSYREQVRGLMDGGADLLLLETVFDTLNAKAAIAAILDEFDTTGHELPVMIPATITRSGRTLSGQTLDAFYVSIRHLRPLSVGLNCAFGARQMRPHLAELSRLVDEHVSCHPNAGLPNASGGYDETPAQTAALLRDFAEAGLLNVVGGCCGTTPEHIRAIHDAVQGLAPRQPPRFNNRRSTGRERVPSNGEPAPSSGQRFTQYAGLETLTLRPDASLIIVGERATVAEPARFATLVADGRYIDAAAMALEEVREGADILAINIDDGVPHPERAITRLLNVIATEPEVARLPFMIDSATWPVLEAGLQAVQGKAIVNSISLEEGEDEFLRKARAIGRYGAALLVAACDERGQAETAGRTIEICERAYRLLIDRLDVDPLDIIFDLGILAFVTDSDGHHHYALDFIEAARLLRASCPGARICGGLGRQQTAAGSAPENATPVARVADALRAGDVVVRRLASRGAGPRG